MATRHLSHALAASSEPLRALAVNPLAPLGPSVGCRVHALSVLFAVHPRAFILTSIGPIKHYKAVQTHDPWLTPCMSSFGKWDFDLPVEGTMSLLLVIDVVSLVLATIGPLKDAVSFHFVVAPHSLVLTTVRPVVDTCDYKEAMP